MDNSDEIKEFVKMVDEAGDDAAEGETGAIVDYDFGAPGDALASHGGSGSGEVREVIRVLHDAGIPSCVVGTHALRYYGAGRVAVSWEIGVPTEKLDEAVHLFKSEPQSKSYEPWPSHHIPQPWSLLHTFPRFHLKGVHFTFYLIPSWDYLMDCKEFNFEKSSMGIPYPKLEILAQSLLDTQRWVDLEDLIDGMNLTEEWGNHHLQLDKTCDIAYAEEKNRKIRASAKGASFLSELLELNTSPRLLRLIWEETVRGKERRMGPELPEGYYSTRFCPKGRGDPRLEERFHV